MTTLALRTATWMTLVLAAPASAQSLWVVDDDPGPGVDFGSVGTAVQAAADGDTVLVRPGDYPGTVELPDRTLFLVADTSGAVVGSPFAEHEVRVGGFRLSQLSAGRRLALRGFSARPSTVGSSPMLHVQSAEGAVYAEDCLFDGGFYVQNGYTRIEGADGATLVRCEITPTPTSLLTLPTLSISGSSAAVLETTAVGMAGAQEPITGTTVEASPALEAVDSEVWLTDCALAGGTGYDANPFATPCTDGGDGAPAVRMVQVGGTTTVEIAACTLTGGQGGAAASASCSAGATGAEVEVLSGVHATHAVSPPRLRIASPLRSGEALDFEVTGAPGASVWLALDLGFGRPQPLPIAVGPVVVDPGLLLLPLGALPPSGLVDEALLPGAIVLPPGLSHLHLFAQPIGAVGGPGGLATGTPSWLTVLAVGS